MKCVNCAGPRKEAYCPYCGDGEKPDPFQYRFSATTTMAAPSHTFETERDSVRRAKGNYPYPLVICG